jgi:hypothetical protein
MNLTFIKENSIGIEGTSAWVWYQIPDSTSWRCYGVAEDTIEESLDLIEQFLINKDDDDDYHY